MTHLKDPFVNYILVYESRLSREPWPLFSRLLSSLLLPLPPPSRSLSPGVKFSGKLPRQSTSDYQHRECKRVSYQNWKNFKNIFREFHSIREIVNSSQINDLARSNSYNLSSIQNAEAMCRKFSSNAFFHFMLVFQQVR